MVHSTTSFFTAILFTIILIPCGSSADSGARDVTWEDLAPGGRDKQEYARKASPLIALFLDLKGEVPAAPRMADELNGKRVRLSGYVVPLGFSRDGVEEFLLVPYVGACVHVPPPPKNQLVLVTSRAPVNIRGLFQAVTVTGTISVGAQETEVAAAGYRLEAADVADYKEYRQIKRLPGHPDKPVRP